MAPAPRGCLDMLLGDPNTDYERQKDQSIYKCPHFLAPLSRGQLALDGIPRAQCLMMTRKTQRGHNAVAPNYSIPINPHVSPGWNEKAAEFLQDFNLSSVIAQKTRASQGARAPESLHKSKPATRGPLFDPKSGNQLDTKHMHKSSWTSTESLTQHPKGSIIKSSVNRGMSRRHLPSQTRMTSAGW